MSDAPKRIWREPTYNAFGDEYFPVGIEGVGVEFVRKDIADELAEALEEAEVLARHALTSSTVRLRGRYIKVREAKERIRAALAKYKETKA